MLDDTGHFATTFDKWRHDIDMRLLWYSGITLCELPAVTPALPNWYRLGASAFMVAQCLATFIG
jgi:hypothetical protein